MLTKKQQIKRGVQLSAQTTTFPSEQEDFENATFRDINEVEFGEENRARWAYKATLVTEQKPVDPRWMTLPVVVC